MFADYYSSVKFFRKYIADKRVNHIDQYYVSKMLENLLADI